MTISFVATGDMKLKCICILLASTLPFLWSFNGDFVFDDSEAILSNKDVFSGSWLDAFYHDFWGSNIKSNFSHKSYRPLTVLSFRLNYILNHREFSAQHYKVTNLMLHILCCFIVWETFKCITIDAGLKRHEKWFRDIPFVGTLIFAVHPIHVEAVSGIVGRADVLAANAFFLAFLIYRQALVKNHKSIYLYLFIVALLATTSMLCKENGITVLGFCISYDLLIVTKLKNPKFNHKKLSKKLRDIVNYKYLSSDLVLRILFVLAATVILLYGRWVVMGGSKPEFKAIDNPAAFADNLFTKIATHNYIYFLNALLLIWPHWLCYDWSMGCVPVIKNIFDYRVIFILLMFSYGALVLRAICSEKIKNKTKRVMISAIFLAAIPFLPASNIFYPVGFVIAERILYISSAGYCLLVALGIYKLSRFEKHLRIKVTELLLSLLILSFGLKSWQRSEDWRTEYQLFYSGLSVCPLNAKVHYNMAKAADAKGNVEWALAEYEKAIGLYDNYYQAMNNYANLLKNQKRYDEAINYLRRAVTIKEDFPVAWMNYGIVLSHIGRYEESEVAYKTALKYRKNYADCYYNLGNLYIEMNRSEEAMASWHHAVSINSTHVRAWTNILAFMDNKGEHEKALKTIPAILAEVPDSPSIMFAAANMYGKINQYDEAEKYFQKAIQLFGSKVQAIHYANFGVLYHRWKKYKKAEEMYKLALQIDPKFKSALTNLESLKKFLK